MKVGDLVQISVESIMSGKGQETVEGFGVIIRDQSPMRPPHVGRRVDVLWGDGEIEEQHTDDLVVINEGSS
jgi:hypothetical protein